MKKFLKSTFFLLALLRISFANAATVNIADGATANVSDVATGDTVNFLGNTGTLAIDGSENIAAITATISQKGTVNFSSVNTLTVAGNIGSGNAIQNIIFNADGTLIANGNVNISSSGITAAVNNQGNITLSGSTAQSVSSIIGSSLLRLNTISITHGNGVTFSGDVFAQNLTTSSSSADVLIGGVGGLNFTNSTFSQNTIINSSGTNSFGAATIADTKTLTINSDSSLGSLTFGATSGNVIIASGKTVSITGDAAGFGLVKGSATGLGTVIFSGAAAQSVASSVEFGDASNRLNTVGVSNISTGGLTLGGDIFTTTLDFSNTSGTATAAIASGKTINLTGNITQSGVGGASVIKGSGKVLLSGTVAQAIDSQLGASTSDRLGALEINNTNGGITLSQNANLSVLTTNDATTITNDAALDASAFAVNDDTSIGGSGTNSLGATTIASLKDLTLNSNASFASLSIGSSGNVVVASSQIATVTGNVSGAGLIKGGSDSVGKVLLSGTSAQTINSGLGSSTSDRLGELEISNSSGVTLGENVFLKTLTQTSGALTIAGGKVIDVNDAIDFSGKTLNIEVGTAPTLFGKVLSNDTITLNSSTTINFDYSNNTLFVDRDSAKLIADSAAISGIVLDGGAAISDVIVTDNSFLFNNDLSIGGDNNDQLFSTIATDTTNFNIDTLGADNFNLLNNVLTNTNLTAGVISISSQQELIDGLSTLKPTANGAIINTSMAMNNAATNIAKIHLQQINSNINGFLADDKYESDEKLWGQIYGSRAKQDKINNVNGYVAGTGGLIFGADHLFKGKINTVLGGAFAYSEANIDSDVSGGSNNQTDQYKISSYQTILYNNNSAKDGLGFYNNNIINFSYNQYKSQRNIIVGSISEVANASFGGYSYGARTDIGYNLKLSDNLLISPNVGVKYFSLNQDNYQETGAGIDGLKVKNKGFSDISSEIGFNITSKFSDQYYTYFPKLSTSWEHSLTGNDQESTVTFIGGGTEMQNNHTNNQENKFNLGLALNIIHPEGPSSLQIEYNLQVAKSFVSNGGSLQYRYAF